jgi:2-oxo-4-hydroxy-4-carboxy--5-ureidoimidazoline (OHCU) decarboxylase
MPVSLADPNALDREGFVAVLGEVFEHAPWIAEAAYVRRPFASRTTLRNALVEVLTGRPRGRSLSSSTATPILSAAPRPSRR